MLKLNKYPSSRPCVQNVKDPSVLIPFMCWKVQRFIVKNINMKYFQKKTWLLLLLLLLKKRKLLYWKIIIEKKYYFIILLWSWLIIILILKNWDKFSSTKVQPVFTWPPTHPPTHPPTTTHPPPPPTQKNTSFKFH